MKQCKPGIVRREIDIDLLIAADHHDIFHHARSHLAGYLTQFETVAMKMDGMNIVTRIVHTQAVALAFLHPKHELHAIFREGDIIDGPEVEAILCGILLGKVMSKI